MVIGDFAYNNAVVSNTINDTERGQTTFIG